MRWTVADIPDQTGRVFVVTGGNNGLGFETCKALASKGARVILACRDTRKGDAAREAIVASGATGEVVVRQLDLASLASVRAFAARLLAEEPRLDVLVNNAGVMAIPRAVTEDGFEMQIGTNHFGHFALTGLLLDRLAATPGARVVNVASSAHNWGTMDFDDLDGERVYDKWAQYGRSKLSNLLFNAELDRRVRAAGKGVLVAAAHPGYAATNLQAVGPALEGNRFMGWIMDVGNALLGQPADMGALPQLYAATAADVVPGGYYGPGGLMEMRGYPKKVVGNRRSQDQGDQRRLWEVSVARTGVDFGGI